MATELQLPALAESMTAASVTAWLKRTGDRVAAGEPLVEVDTEKTTVEIEAPVSGILREIVVPAGTDEVEVGTVLAVIEPEGDEDAATQGTVEPAPEVAPTKQPPAETEVEPRVSSAAPDEPGPPPGGTAPTVDATPLARAMAVAAGLDLARLADSGLGARITKRDVDRALGVESPPDALPSAPRSAMQRVTAQRMAEAKRTVPHFYVATECDMTALDARRREYNAEHVPVTITAIFVRAAAQVLQTVPAVNALWQDDGVRQQAASHVAVAVNTRKGLMAPVIRHAERKSLADIAAELQDLSARARDQRLTPEDYTGGTFTISNLGMFGVSSLYAIVNIPQSSILGIGAVTERPVVRDGSIEAAQMATLTLSADHRVIDGAAGGEFLKALRKLIETPATLF